MFGPLRVRGVKEAEKQAKALLAKVGLAEQAPLPLRAFRRSATARVAIARALAGETKMMLFDEQPPLGPELRHEVLAKVMRIWQEEGMTMSLSLHEIGFAEKSRLTADFYR